MHGPAATPPETAGAPRRHDVAIVGFGYAGLATLVHLVDRASSPLRVAVVGDDLSGHGLAYGTRDPEHLLNVPAARMSAIAADGADFVRWLEGPDAADARRRLGVGPVASTGYAPRALYAAYLDAVRARTVRHAAAARVEITWIAGSAERLAPAGEGWVVRVGDRALSARAAVLATGNEPKSLTGSLRHPRLHRGPWALDAQPVAGWEEPVLLLGTSLTAVDALISLRRRGYRGRIVAASRHGLLPWTHPPQPRPVPPPSARARAIRTVADVVSLIEDLRRAGYELPEIVDGLRPHTAAIWQRLGTEQQRLALERHVAAWGVLRHRVAPTIGARIARERAEGGLEVRAVSAIDPVPDGERLHVVLTARDGTVERLTPAAVIDCAGFQLDWTRSERPLLRALVADGVVRPHPTGLGVAADDLRVAPGLHALGSLLTGQLWESVAVPELREQADRIAARLALIRAAGDADR